MAIDRNETFDVIVVGAGPAGSAAALRLAEQRAKVLLIERGTAPGAKNMMGGRIYTHSLERLVPDFRERAPLERKVTKERISIGTGNEMTTIEYSNQDGKPNEESYVVLRAKFDKWLAGEAEKKGALLVSNVQVTDLITEGEGKNRRVVGVAVTMMKFTLNSLSSLKVPIHCYWKIWFNRSYRSKHNGCRR